MQNYLFTVLIALKTSLFKWYCPRSRCLEDILVRVMLGPRQNWGLANRANTSSKHRLHSLIQTFECVLWQRVFLPLCRRVTVRWPPVPSSRACPPETSSWAPLWTLGRRSQSLTAWSVGTKHLVDHLNVLSMGIFGTLLYKGKLPYKIPYKIQFFLPVYIMDVSCLFLKIYLKDSMNIAQFSFNRNPLCFYH